MAVPDVHAEYRSYQHEKLSTAVRGVFRQAAPTAAALAVVMHELEMAFHDAPPTPGAEPSWATIRALMSGSSSWATQAESLNEVQVREFLNAVWDLYEATARAYYTAQQA
jgi:hypothetical protein